MALTTLDPKIALILIDLQIGIVSVPTAHPASDIVANSRALADAFRRRSLPVVLVNVTAGAPGRTEQPPFLVATSPPAGLILCPVSTGNPKIIS